MNAPVQAAPVAAEEQALFEQEKAQFGYDFTRFGSTVGYESDRTNAAFGGWKAGRVAPVAAPVAQGDAELRIAALEKEAADWRAEADKAVAWLWRDGEPPFPWSEEWFVAETIYGDRVVLRALAKEHAYDYETADKTFMARRNVKRWTQFPDSQYKAAPADDRLTALQAQVDLLSASLKQADAVCSELTALVAALGGKVLP